MALDQIPFPNSLITFVPFPVTKVEKGSVGSSIEVMGTQQDKPAVARNKTIDPESYVLDVTPLSRSFAHNACVYIDFQLRKNNF